MATWKVMFDGGSHVLVDHPARDPVAFMGALDVEEVHGEPFVVLRNFIFHVGAVKAVSRESPNRVRGSGDADEA